MSYSQPEGSATFFSYNRSKLMEFDSTLRNQLDKTGGSYEGPMPLPQVDQEQIDRFLLSILNSDSNGTADNDEFPHWLFELARDDESREILLTASKNDCGLHGRRYNFLDKRTVKVGFSLEPPSSVGVIAQLDKRTHGKGGGGPVTWNPNVDHIPSHPDGQW